MKKFLATAAAVATMATSAAAHTIGIGWLDNGNGSVTLYAEHWHGDQSSPSTANGGLGVYDGSGTFLYKTQWTSVINNQDLNGNDTPTSTSSLTGYGPDPLYSANYPTGTNDWLVSDPLVLGNGTWGFFTGTTCCIDTMSAIVNLNVTGITSVDPGTGPGGVGGQIPLPAAGWMLLAGLGGFAAMRRRQSA